MKGVDDWTWVHWVVNIPLGAFTLMCLLFVASLFWDMLTKESYGNEYASLKDIATRVVTLVVMVLLFGFCAVVLDGCPGRITHPREDTGDY